MTLSDVAGLSDALAQSGVPVLTDADRAHYAEHGWWATPRPVLTEQELQAARDALTEVHESGTPDDAPVSQQKSHLNWRPGSDAVMRINNYAAFLHPGLYQLVCHPAIGAMAAQLSDSPEIRLFNSSIVYKPAGVDQPDNQVGWHTDKAYWSTCTSSRMLTAWIPLYDVVAESGPLTVLDGSHRWPESAVADLRMVRGFMAEDRTMLERVLRQRGVEYRPVQMVLKAGHVSFHHCMTFHGSAPNVSDRPRVAVTSHLQDGANRWRLALNPDGSQAHYQHEDNVARDCHGNPDYSDPKLCPTIWPPSTDEQPADLAGAGDPFATGGAG